MKPRQSSIYRKLEMLHLWASSLADRCPKSLSFQVEGKAVLDDINNALLVAKFALKAPSGPDRLQHIDTLDVYLADLDTHVTELRERSKPKNAPARVVTQDQFADFLAQMSSIEQEMAAWRNANIGKQAPVRQPGSASD